MAGKSNAQQGQDNPYQTVPVKILDDVIYAESDILAITADGTLYGWGNNDDNQLGYAGGNSVGGWLSTPCQNTPKPVTTNVAAVVSGTRVLKRDGSLWTIGSNYRGTTGDLCLHRPRRSDHIDQADGSCPASRPVRKYPHRAGADLL